MHARLVENWLDSASERSYQAVFVQMLAAEGYRIIHSTRHSPIELGKDIVAVAPDGTPCAYQLKGNPGSRMTLAEFRDIEGQLKQLTDLAIVHGELAGRQHSSYLVTNGLVEEEVVLAIAQMNQSQVNNGYPDRQLLVIQRGDLLESANRLGHALWPSELPQTHLLLEMLVEEGTGGFPAERWHNMLSQMLGLTDTRPKWTANELRRRVSSTAILTGICLKKYEEADNHFAIVGAWVQFAVAAIGACDRLNISYDRNAATAVNLALTSIRDALVDLASEALARNVLTEGDPFVDSPFYRPRQTLVSGLLSLLWLWCEESEWPHDLPRSEVEDFLVGQRSGAQLWGEAAVPQLLAYQWFLRRVRAGLRSDEFLADILRGLSHIGADGEPDLVPDPYWGCESVIRHQLAPLFEGESDDLSRYLPNQSSYFAESVLQLLARTNSKQTCRSIWPGISRLQFSEFVPPQRWRYCVSHSTKGTTRDTQPPLMKEWSELVAEARSVRCESVPVPLLDLPVLHWLFVLLFPYRGSPDVVRRVSFKLNPAWMISHGPIE